MLKIQKEKSSQVYQFRKRYLKKGFELVDITQLCEFKLGNSGCCNGFNEPDENIYHVQVWYRGEEIAMFSGDRSYVIDDDKYAMFVETGDAISNSFIIFKLCKNEPKRTK